MNNDNKNIIIKLLENKIKPDFYKFSIQELFKIYEDLTKNNFKYFEELKFIYPNLINTVKNIFDKNIELNEITEKNIINWFNCFWKNLPLINNENFEIIECPICLEYISNNNYTILHCEHVIHTECYFNYLFTNFKNNTEDYKKLFRCPSCRKYLTTMIENSSQQNTLIDHINNDFDENNEFNDFPLIEYNLLSNSINDLYLNNVFTRLNNNAFNTNIIIEDDDEYSISSSENS